jgi:prophage regulatory protein
VRYARRSKNLAKPVPAVAQQLALLELIMLQFGLRLGDHDQLQEAIRTLGAEIGAVLLAAQQQRVDHHVIRRSCSPSRGYRVGQVAERLSVHPQTLWRWIREGRFPKGIKIGPMTTIWTETMLADWLEKKAKENRPAQLPTGHG